MSNQKRLEKSILHSLMVNTVVKLITKTYFIALQLVHVQYQNAMFNVVMLSGIIE